jgi:hypothetical protein
VKLPVASLKKAKERGADGSAKIDDNLVLLINDILRQDWKGACGKSRGQVDRSGRDAQHACQS